jgi:hypothetical protein
MTSLKEFLEDTQTAIDNGFGKKETILRMFNALYATMELCDEWKTKGSYCLPIEEVIQAIEKELND